MFRLCEIAGIKCFILNWRDDYIPFIERNYMVDKLITIDYNNKNYIKEIDLDCNDSSEIVLIYLDVGKLEIVEHNFKMATYDKLKDDLLDNLEDASSGSGKFDFF